MKKSAISSFNKTSIVFFVLLFVALGVCAQQPNGGSIEKVWTDHGVTKNGEKGMNIHTHFKVRGMKGIEGGICVFFYDADGKALTAKPTNNKYITPLGKVTVQGKYSPTYDNSNYSDYSLFLPYSAIPLPDGDHKLNFSVIVFDDSYNKIASSTGHVFSFSRGDGNSAIAENTNSPEAKPIINNNTVVPPKGSEANVASNMTSDEVELYRLIMEYRQQRGLPNIPVSKSLTYVAQVHAKDLEENFVQGSGCNMHSWSSKGNWTPCCYTSDHAQAACLWNKPRELTSYKGDGFEIAHMNSAGATPLRALNGWKGSSGHNNVIINASNWANKNWKAIGVGMNGKYAVVWFGAEEDNSMEATPATNNRYTPVVTPKGNTSVGPQPTNNNTAITNTGSKVTAAQAKEALDFHNKARAEVGVQSMVWSAELSRAAQEWAEHLAANNGCEIEHSSNDNYGENLYWGSGRVYTALDASKDWYSEIKDFKNVPIGSPNLSLGATGHYTQMVWHNTTQLGMGVAICPNGSYIIVAKYNPAGNYTGQKAY